MERPLKFSRQVEQLIWQYANEQLNIPTKSFTDLTKLMKGGYHALIQGITGAGKTTLLLNLERELYSHGHIIIHRDDGGLEFLKLLGKVDALNIFYPKGVKFRLHLKKDFNTDIDLIPFDWEKPISIFKEIDQRGLSYNAIVFDIYVLEPHVNAIFWSKFFETLIYYVMQKQISEKEKIVLSIDELNDLVQPNNYEITEVHKRVRSLIEYNIRKLRKHLVTLIASTHRPNQISVNLRSQFSYIFVKKSFGNDIYDFINKMLVQIKNKTFFRILHDIITLDPRYAYVFDYKGNFDKISIPNIEWEKGIKYETQGLISMRKDFEKFDERDIAILLYAISNKSYRKIGKELGFSSPATIYQRLNRMLKNETISKALVELKLSNKIKKKDK